MTEPTPLTLARFVELIDAYGADAARWPTAERDAALVLCERNAEAAALLAQARALDALLDQAPDYELPAGLAARVAEIPARQARGAHATNEALWTRPRMWGALLAALTACALGAVSGTLLDSAELDTAHETITTDTTDTTHDTTREDEAWDDLAAIALAENFGREP